MFSDEDSFDKALVVLFGKCRLSEALPPKSNALQLHMYTKSSLPFNGVDTHNM